MTRIIEYEARVEDVGRRADVVVSDHTPELSRSLARSLIDHGRVTIDGVVPKPSRRTVASDHFRVELVLPPSISAEPEDIPLKIVYQDRDIAVIDKPVGLVVHPAPGHETGTLANALVSLFPQSRDVGSGFRPGIVHRLDKDTSGLMAVALSPTGHASLQQQISSRTAGRRYLALASGEVLPHRGTIDAPIGRDPQLRTRMAAHGVAARPAQTSYEVLDLPGGYTFLEATLHTGRTHQIRVHLAALGHPIVGDSLYGGPAFPGLSRQFLHAHRLTLQSPNTGANLDFTAPLPPDLQAVLDVLHAK